MGDSDVMIVDPGARGHVLARKYLESPDVRRVIVAPGNDFVEWSERQREREVIIVQCNHKDPNSILEVAQKYKPHLIDVAQDDSLGNGAVDLLQWNGYQAFGPTRLAAEIESNKAWSRNFMRRHGIPHPDYKVFTSKEGALAYLRELYDENPEAA